MLIDTPIRLHNLSLNFAIEQIIENKRILVEVIAFWIEMRPHCEVLCYLPQVSQSLNWLLRLLIDRNTYL